jgi:DNA-binding transcriptional LysR family regulator
MLMSPDPLSGKPLSLAQASARLRFRHLQFLDILGRTRNLRLTAEQMHITQPAATKILMDIEDIVQARLFERLSRGMRPNELGLFMLRYAASALAGQRKFVDEFNALKQGGHGHLAIGAITGSAAHVLIASVAEIQRLRPLLVLKVLEQSSDQLVVWLAERKIDLMIGRFTDASQRTQFHYERLSDEPLQVVGGLHHRCAARASWTWPSCRTGPGFFTRPRPRCARCRTTSLAATAWR